MRSLIGFNPGTIQKAPHEIPLYNVLDANVLKLHAQNKYDLWTTGLPIMFIEFSASTGAVP